MSAFTWHGHALPSLAPTLPPPAAGVWQPTCPDCEAPAGAAHRSGVPACAEERRCYHCAVARVPPPKVGEVPRCDRCKTRDARMRERGVHRG